MECQGFQTVLQGPPRIFGWVCVERRVGNWNSAPVHLQTECSFYILGLLKEKKKKRGLITSNLMQPSNFTSKHGELKRGNKSAQDSQVDA